MYIGSTFSFSYYMYIINTLLESIIHVGCKHTYMDHYMQYIIIHVYRLHNVCIYLSGFFFNHHHRHVHNRSTIPYRHMYTYDTCTVAYEQCLRPTATLHVTHSQYTCTLSMYMYMTCSYMYMYTTHEHVHTPCTCTCTYKYNGVPYTLYQL